MQLTLLKKAKAHDGANTRADDSNGTQRVEKLVRELLELLLLVVGENGDARAVEENVGKAGHTDGGRNVGGAVVPQARGAIRVTRDHRVALAVLNLPLDIPVKDVDL